MKVLPVVYQWFFSAADICFLLAQALSHSCKSFKLPIHQLKPSSCVLTAVQLLWFMPSIYSPESIAS